MIKKNSNMPTSVTRCKHDTMKKNSNLHKIYLHRTMHKNLYCFPIKNLNNFK